MRRLALLGATLVTLVVSGAAQFSYDALTNQDYLQFGDVRTPAFGCLTRASCHVSDDAFLFIDEAAVSKPAVRQVLHPALFFAASGQSEYMRHNLILLQHCMMLSGCRSGRGHLLAKCGYVSSSGDWLQLQTSLFKCFFGCCRAHSMGTSRTRMRREPAACQRTMRTPCTCPGLQEPLSHWPSTAINLTTAAPAASASCTGVRCPLPTRRAILGPPTGTGMVYILSSKKNKAILIYAEQRWSGDEMVLGWRHAEMVRFMAAKASGGALGVCGGAILQALVAALV